MLWFILLLGVLLRLVNLNQSLWLDEAISAQAIRNYNLVSLVTKFMPYDFHPVGYYQLLWLWSRVAGDSEIALRIPSALFGIATIYLVFKTGRLLKDEGLGLIAATLMAVNPLAIYYSQEARMYSYAALAVSASLYFFLKIYSRKYKTNDLIFYSLSLVFIFTSDYVAYLIIPIQALLIITLKNKKNYRDFFVCLLPILLLGLLWLPIFFRQIKQGLSIASNIVPWRAVVGSFGLKPLVLTYVKFIIGRISLQNDLLYGLLLLPVLAVFSVVLCRARNKKLWILLLGPITLAWSISYFVPIYDYFRVLYLVPVFILLVSLGLVSFRRSLQPYLLGLIVTIELIASSLYLFNNNFHREDWRGVVDYLKQQKVPVILENSEVFAPLEYYRLDRSLIVTGLAEEPTVPKVYLLNYLVEVFDPKATVRSNLGQLGYKQVDVKNFNGVGLLYLYQK